MPHCNAAQNFGIDLAGCAIFHYVFVTLAAQAQGLRRQCPAGSEEPELLRAVTDQHVLGLLVVVEHHLVGLAADARLLVATERRMRRIGMVAVGPDPAGLDRTA